MSWKRLRERFLSEIETEDDVSAVLRGGGAPRFLVAILDGDDDAFRAHSPSSLLSTPRRVSPHRVTPTSELEARRSASSSTRGKAALLEKAARQSGGPRRD